MAGTLVPPLNGGTGVANANTMTTTRVGAFGLTVTLTGTTSVTFPTSGTLATTAGTVASATNLAGGPGIPFNASAGVTSFSSDYTYNDTTKRSTIGSGSGASAGVTLGNNGSSGSGYIIGTATAGGANDFSMRLDANTTIFNSPGTTIISAGNITKITQTNTAGAGPSITAGTAATDVPATSITRTNNNAAVATGVKIVFTDTTSAAGFLPFQVLGGAAAATNLLSVSKVGLVDAPAYSAGGSAGVDFGPSIVTSITVKKGIIIAIS